MWENISLKRDKINALAFEKSPRISFICKLVPVQFQEYENLATSSQCLDIAGNRKALLITHANLNL